MTIKVTKEHFVETLTKLLKETYPDVTKEIIEKELDSQRAGNAPAGIMGMFVADNLKKVTITEL